jgi:hypothetical protein
MWMKGAKKSLADVGEGLVAEFVDNHLPECHCATSARHPSSVRAALGHLLVVLRAAGAIAPRPLDMTEVGQELRRYDQYMEQVRGLAPNTRDGALRLVEALLRQHFGDGAIRFEVITPQRVRRFFAAQAKNYKAPTSLGAVVSALRGYFRWRATLGDCTHALVGALAYPANWQLASLPKSLEPAEVEQGAAFIERALDRQTARVRAAPQQIGASGAGLFPVLEAIETPVGQAQHAGLQAGQQRPAQFPLAAAVLAEVGAQQGVRGALGDDDATRLRVT